MANRNFYVGVDGVANSAAKIYLGQDDVARLIYDGTAGGDGGVEFGDTDLTDGVSELEHGHVYFYAPIYVPELTI